MFFQKIADLVSHLGSLCDTCCFDAAVSSLPNRHLNLLACSEQ